MVSSDTQVRFRVTNNYIYDEGGEAIHGSTEPIGALGMTDGGTYKSVLITISLADFGRYEGASDGEKINAIGSHESVSYNFV